MALRQAEGLLGLVITLGLNLSPLLRNGQSQGVTLAVPLPREVSAPEERKGSGKQLWQSERLGEERFQQLGGNRSCADRR